MPSLEPPLLNRHRYTVDEYYRMGEAGIFEAAARVELIDGAIIDMEPKATRHASATLRINAQLGAVIKGRAIVSVHNPLRLDEYSEPEPDLVLLKRRDDFYRDAHPGAADALLIVEIAETTPRYDREIKLPLYARHGVPEVWIVDLDARVVRFHRHPSGQAYADTAAAETPGRVVVSALGGAVIDLSGVLG